MQDPPPPPLTMSDRAREWGRALLAVAPWEAVADRVTLIVLAPPAGIEDLPDPLRARLLLTIDRAATPSLPPELGRPLHQGEATVRQHHARAGDEGSLDASLAVISDEGLHRLLQGLTRTAMELRWQLRHAETVADRMHRLEQYQVRAGMLPADGLERIIRALWVEATLAVRGLDPARSDRASDALPAAGEAAAALSRIACAWEEAAYPPVEYLRLVAGETRIGRRIGPWLDDFTLAVGGDEAAARRTLSSREQALHEVRQVLAERFRNRPWLADPEAFALRAPR